MFTFYKSALIILGIVSGVGKSFLNSGGLNCQCYAERVVERISILWRNKAVENNSFVDTILPYVREISERLFANHASVMVGSGFSKNAERGEVDRSFPLWNELGDIFYKKLYNKIPTEKEKAYLDVLKLAGEVEAAFGRPVLNNIIKANIPDKYSRLQIQIRRHWVYLIIFPRI